MRAAIFNPYLDTLGGGERYTLSFAKVLSEAGWSVDVEWKSSKIKPLLASRFGFDLANVNFIQDIKRGDGYDLCFWVSDGSIPTLRARKNFLHFQVPFHDVGGKSLLNKMKLFRINKIICNSFFTKRVIDKEYGVESIVLYPPVDTIHIKPKRKENLVLSVGRFSQLKQSKRQDILIRAFKKLFDEGLNDWKFVLAGGVEVGAGDYLKRLEEKVNGYPIEIVKSPDFKTLRDCYGKAKVFWSAAGYNESESKFPEKVEHFGISVVEGMSAGAVPIVLSAGGHKEIVQDGVNGFLWKSIEGLVRKTGQLVRNPQILKKMSHAARDSAQKFGLDRFKKEIISLI